MKPPRWSCSVDNVQLLRPRARIVLQTRAGTDIPNDQEHELSKFEENLFGAYKKKFTAPACHWRTEAIPVYNCHGMTFASRRTRITETWAVQRILADDQYEEIAARDVHQGDVVIYWTDDGDLEHSGLVVSRGTHPLYVPMICSKWGGGGEVIHPANNCPYEAVALRYYRVQR